MARSTRALFYDGSSFWIAATLWQEVPAEIKRIRTIAALTLAALLLMVGSTGVGWADDNDNSDKKPAPKPAAPSEIRPDLQPDFKVEYAGYQNPSNTQLVKFKISNLGTAASPATKVTVVTLVPEPTPWLREIDVPPLAIGGSTEIYYPLAALCNGHKVRATLKYPGDLDPRNDQADGDVCAGPDMPNLDSSRITGTGLSAIPEHLRKGEHRLEVPIANSAVYKRAYREEGCLTTFPVPTTGLEAGFINHEFSCRLNVVWQAALSFDLEQLTEARSKADWFPTDAVLSFKETPNRNWEDTPETAFLWNDAQGDSHPTNTCWLRLGMPTSNWAGSESDTIRYELVREAETIGRWTVFTEVLQMVADPVLEQRGFVIVGPNERMDPDGAGCRSRIEDVKLTVTYTIP
jgi:hypothetical protein